MGDYVYREQAGATRNAQLLFLLHGTGGDENQLLDLGQQLLPGARLISPRGDISEFGAARFFKRTGEGVYDMDDLARATGKLADFMRQRIAESEPSEVLALGYSNGANILASVLAAEPDLFDGAVLMHPLIPFDLPAAPGLQGKRILITAGRRDPIAPAAQTQRLADYFLGQNASLDLLWHEGGHGIEQQELIAALNLLRQRQAA